MIESIEDARAVLAAHAFLHDDPDAYLAGVEDALRLVLSDAQDGEAVMAAPAGQD